MANPHIVVQMMIRNEADIIEECLREIVSWGLDEIVVLDGASTDGTLQKVAGFIDADIDVRSTPDPCNRFADHRRNELLEMTLRHDPDWILSLDADEIYDTNPASAIRAAHAAGANVVRCYVPQFWITLSDIRDGILTEDPRASVQERRRWYSWGHAGTFIWRANPDHYYPPDKPKRTPELPGLSWRQWQVAGPVTPICKHYPFRSLEQALTRTRERLERGGRRYFGKYAENWIIDEQAAGLACRQDGEWDRRTTHDAVYRYMGRKESQ